MKAAYYTLGCKVNQYDTQVMRDRLEKAGYQTVAFEEKADIYIVNTCTVTAESDRKSKQMIRRAAQNADMVVVSGCFSQIDSETASAMEKVNNS